MYFLFFCRWCALFRVSDSLLYLPDLPTGFTLRMGSSTIHMTDYYGSACDHYLHTAELEDVSSDAVARLVTIVDAFFLVLRRPSVVDNMEWCAGVVCLFTLRSPLLGCTVHVWACSATTPTYLSVWFVIYLPCWRSRTGAVAGRRYRYGRTCLTAKSLMPSISIFFPCQ